MLVVSYHLLVLNFLMTAKELIIIATCQAMRSGTVFCRNSGVMLTIYSRRSLTHATRQLPAS
ncbi:hypothetical protein QL093DRAFT_2271501 [Fusarium oxysporum]|nr:hypothetical protein QL093DRAFT_2271501 [Fusarium oxysporum]